MEQLQQATFRCGVNGSSASLVMFELTGIAAELFPLEGRGADEKRIPLPDRQEPPEGLHVLDWRHTCKDPFAGQWEHILIWVQENPTRSSGDIFRELQSLFPGRYQPQHIRTLQRGMHRIRAYVLSTREQAQQREHIHGDAINSPHTEPVSQGTTSLPFLPTRPVDPCPGESSRHASHPSLTAESPAVRPSGKAKHLAAPPPT